MTLGDKFKKFDLFDQRIAFKINGGEGLTSYLGASLSIMISIVTLFYAYSRFDTMLKYGDTVYQSV